jgi:hypothetical protein
MGSIFTIAHKAREIGAALELRCAIEERDALAIYWPADQAIATSRR